MRIYIYKGNIQKKTHLIFSVICHSPFWNKEVELICMLHIVQFKLMMFCCVTNWKHLSGITLLHLLHFLKKKSLSIWNIETRLHSWSPCAFMWLAVILFFTRRCIQIVLSAECVWKLVRAEDPKWGIASVVAELLNNTLEVINYFETLEHPVSW